MKKVLIVALIINNVLYGETEKPQEERNLVKKGLIVAGFVGGCGLCVLAKRNWSSVAWATKEFLKEQIGQVNTKLDTIVTDVSVIRRDTSAIRRDVLESHLSLSAKLEEVEARLGDQVALYASGFVSKKDLEKLQITVDQIKTDTSKILEILEKNR